MEIHRRFNWACVLMVYMFGTTLGAFCSYPGEPANGQTIGGNYAVGQTVEFTCNVGYKRNGMPRATCLADLTWSQSVPVCDAVKCPALNPPANGQVSWAGIGDYMQTVVFSCDTDYFYSLTPNTRQCQQDETWSGQVGTCLEIDCGTPTLVNGYATLFGGTGYADYVSFSCIPGATMEGEEMSQCNQQQQWEPPVPICNLNCAELTSENADLIVLPGTKNSVHGATATVYCKNISPRVDHNPLCNNGTWVGYIPACLPASTTTKTAPIVLPKGGATPSSGVFTSDEPGTATHIDVRGVLTSDEPGTPTHIDVLASKRPVIVMASTITPTGNSKSPPPPSTAKMFSTEAHNKRPSIVRTLLPGMRTTQPLSHMVAMSSIRVLTTRPVIRITSETGTDTRSPQPTSVEVMSSTEGNHKSLISLMTTSTITPASTNTRPPSPTTATGTKSHRKIVPAIMKTAPTVIPTAEGTDTPDDDDVSWGLFSKHSILLNGLSALAALAVGLLLCLCCYMCKQKKSGPEHAPHDVQLKVNL